MTLTQDLDNMSLPTVLPNVSLDFLVSYAFDPSYRP